MVNSDRIVPIQRIDFLSLIGTVLKLAGTSYAVINAADGNFEVTGSGAAGNKLASQPVKTVDFKTGVTSGVVYFVADYDFDKILVAGASATISDSGLDYEDMAFDAITLYKAELSSGSVIITAVTP